MEISIRKLTSEDDLIPVLDLCMEFFSEYERYHKDFFNTDTLNYTDISERFRESTKSNDSITFIAMEENNIIGYILAGIRNQPDFYKVKKAGVISGLMVENKYRRKGIGSQLLSKVKSYFEENGIKYYTVYTAVNNRGAIEFYNKNKMQELHTTLIGETKAQPDVSHDRVIKRSPGLRTCR